MDFNSALNHILLLSIKPQFASKIFEGTKRIELRKSKPRVSKGDYVIIYVTTPVKAIKGVCRVKEVILSEPSDLWKNRADDLGVDKVMFKSYYDGHNICVGIELEDVIELEEEIPLNEIRSKVPKFAPPQTFRYFEPEVATTLF